MWLLWTWVTAVAMWVIENLFDGHKSEVQGIIATQKPHTLKWYEAIAKAFQYGDSLPADSAVYNPIVPAHQIVTQCAVVESNPRLLVKVAKTAAGVLAPLAAGELTALTAYLNRVKDAGVRLAVTSIAADDVQLELLAYYDPLVIDVSGARLDGTSATPLLDATNAFFSNLPFNGLFVVNRLADALEQVEGFRIVRVFSAQARHGVLAYADVGTEYLPESGYLKNDDAFFVANVGYAAHGPID